MIFVPLVILLTSSPSQALTPPPAPSVIACINYEPGQISLSESNIKRIENFTDLLIRVPNDLIHIAVLYNYPIQANSNTLSIELAMGRGENLLKELSNRIGKTDIATIPLLFDISSDISHPNCEVIITADYWTNKASKLLCQPNSDFCSYVKCDDKGCAE